MFRASESVNALGAIACHQMSDSSKSRAPQALINAKMERLPRASADSAPPSEAHRIHRQGLQAKCSRGDTPGGLVNVPLPKGGSKAISRSEKRKKKRRESRGKEITESEVKFEGGIPYRRGLTLRLRGSPA